MSEEVPTTPSPTHEEEPSITQDDLSVTTPLNISATDLSTTAPTIRHKTIHASAPTPAMLFDIKKTKKPEMWCCIKLVAPSEDISGKIWTSKDAVGAWCTRCQKRLRYTSGSINTVMRHMESLHKSLIEEYITQRSNNKPNAAVETNSNGKRPIQSNLFNYYATSNGSNKKKMTPASKADQLMGEALLVEWTATSLRPFSIVEDEGLRNFGQFLNDLNKQFAFPSRNKHREQIVLLSKFVMNRVKEIIKSTMEYFCVTTDIWSSRVMESYLALTLHFVTPDFEMATYVLKVDPIEGRHTGELIKTLLQNAFTEFGLDEEKLAMLLRDNASNGVKACNDWGIKHFGCIGHSLHLVVGPFLVEKKSKKAAGLPSTNASSSDSSTMARMTVNHPVLASATVADNEADNDSDDEADDVADYDDCDVEEGNEDPPLLSMMDLVDEVRSIVTKFRAIAKYARSSTIAKEKLTTLAQLAGSLKNNTFSIGLDVSTRWNSTLKMLSDITSHRGALDLFLGHLKTPDGRKEFHYKVLPDVSPVDWALIEGLCLLLRPFEEITSTLSGEKYPTFALALPLLRVIKTTLSDTSLFAECSRTTLESQTKEKPVKPGADFKLKYVSDPFNKVLLSKLQACQKVMLDSFTTRFQAMNIDIMWVTLLDPRFRQMKHLSKSEYSEAKRLLISEVVELRLASMNQDLNGSDDAIETSSTESLPQCLSIFDSPPPQAQESSQMAREIEESSVRREVDNYLDPNLCFVPIECDPLKWWSVQKFNYPRIALAARKWLCVGATSTASERVFSSCGLAITAKRSRMQGDMLQCQVLVQKNMNLVNMSHDDVCLALRL